MTNEIVVRRVRPGDGPLIRAVRLRALHTDPTSFGSTLAREERYGDDAWADWASEDSAGAAAATYLALAGDEPVGMVGAYRDKADGRFHIVAMWVAPEVRGRGTGRALLTAAEGWIASEGGEVAWLSVTDRAGSASRLYASAGYGETGERSTSPHTAGVVHIELRKSLGSS